MRCSKRRPSGSATRKHVPSGTAPSCQREPKQGLTHRTKSEIRALNLESNIESNFEERAREVENLVRQAAKALSANNKRHASSTALASADAPRNQVPGAPQLPFGPRSGGRR